MVGGLVEDEHVDAPDLEHGQRGPGALARGQRGRRAGHVLGGEPELGQQPSGPRPGRRRRWRRGTRRAGWARRRTGRGPGSISPTSTLGPSQRAPDASGSRPNRAPSSVDFPEPLRPTTATRSPQPHLQVDRTEREVGSSPRPAGRRRPRPAGPRRRRCGRRRRSAAAGPSPRTACRPGSSRARARSVALALAATLLGAGLVAVADELVGLPGPLDGLHALDRPLALGPGPFPQRVALRRRSR